MATIKLEIPFESIHGKLTQNSNIIYRRKTTRNHNGNVVRECPKKRMSSPNRATGRVTRRKGLN